MIPKYGAFFCSNQECRVQIPFQGVHTIECGACLTKHTFLWEGPSLILKPGWHPVPNEYTPMFDCSKCRKPIPFDAEKYDGAMEATCKGCGTLHHFLGDLRGGSLRLFEGPLEGPKPEITALLQPKG